MGSESRDIVERLREYARQSDPPTSTLYDLAADDIALLVKERDEMSNLAVRDGNEIERLRAELAALARHVLQRLAAAVVVERDRAATIADAYAKAAISALPRAVMSNDVTAITTQISVAEQISAAIRATPAGGTGDEGKGR